MLFRSGIRKRLGHFDHIIIALAGPALQFLSAIVVAAIVIALGLPTMFLTGTIDWLVAHGVQVPLVNGLGIGKNPLLFAACECYVYVSIFWPLINLLPIFPLDGGKVVQHGAAIVRRSDGLMEAHLIGTVFGFLVAWWFFQNGGSFNAMLFLFLAWDNMTALQRFGGPPRW